MKKYFTIMLATAIAYVTVTPVAYAQQASRTQPPVNCVSEPVALLVSLTALGLFVAARRRQTA